jgi:uncharacterized iron-regulated membrane protein
VKQFRKILFWVHLVIGLVAGAIIAITVVTGASMSFEKQVIAWMERDIRKVKAPSVEAPRLTLEELTKKIREVQPEARPVNIIVAADPTEPVIFILGRTNTVYLNPYTGEIQPQGAPKTRAFFAFMLKWHRWLGAEAPGQGPSKAATAEAPKGAPKADEGAKPERKPMTAREMGSTVMGISATIFMLLSISGLYLWWPRSWSWKNVRAIVVPRLRENGKPRDWNWHNAFGFWASPIIIVMSFTGIVIAFHAVGDFIYKRPQGADAQALLAPVSVPEPGTRPVGQDVLLANVQQALPHWETILFRNNQKQRGGEKSGPQPVQIAVEVAGANLLPVQVQLDPFTGEVLRQETLADMGLRRGFRTLNRTLHTGEAFGLVGQAVALLACLSGILLVYTGFALAFRRWRNWRRGKQEQNAKAESAVKQPMETETAAVP